MGVGTAPECCKNDTHRVTKAVEEQRENIAFHIFSLFKGSLPVGALKVLWRSLTSSLEKTLRAGPLPLLSHHSFTRFAASTQHNGRRRTTRGHHRQSEIEWALTGVIWLWARFLTYFRHNVIIGAKLSVSNPGYVSIISIDWVTYSLLLHSLVPRPSVMRMRGRGKKGLGNNYTPARALEFDLHLPLSGCG